MQIAIYLRNVMDALISRTQLTSLFILVLCLLPINPSLAQDPQASPAALPSNSVLTHTKDSLSSDQSATKNEMLRLESFIDGYVTSKINDFEPAGMTVAVVLGDQTFTKGYGLSNAETGALNDEQTLFRIGSISKLFVWLSVHMLAEEGKLDLDKPLNEYAPALEIKAAFNRQITMRDLMSHRPGFEDHLQDFVDPNRNISIEEAVTTRKPLRVAPPGERTSYSNTGTNMAAYVIEQVSKMPYYEFVETRILKPVGLSSTTLRDPGLELNPAALEARMASPHKLEAGVAKVTKFMSIRPQEPVGAVAMDAADAAKFMRMLLNQTKYEGGRLLSDDTWQKLQSPAFENAIGDDMGWGFMLNEVDGFSTFGHGGATQFLSWMFVIPELDMGVFVSSNMNSAASRGEKLAWSIVRQVTGTGTLADFLAIKGNVDEANAIAGTYLNNRRPFSGAANLFNLGSDTQITATEDGYLLMPGSTLTRYAPIAENLWVNQNGARLGVIKDNDGKVIRLQSGLGSSTLEKIGFLSSTNALLIGFGGTILFTITSILGMYYRFRRETGATTTGRILRWVNVLSILIWITFFVSLGIAAVALVNLDISIVDESPFPPSALKVALFLMYMLCIQSIIYALSLWPLWVKSAWTIWQRTHFTLYAGFTFFAVFLLFHWGLIGADFYGL
jgi:CubicO group peptidase (beta-lactamase class C family)